MAPVMAPVVLTLVCSGHRAQCDSSLQQNSNQSLIKELTETATVVYRGIFCLEDGEHHGVYEGRGAFRDVYRIGEGVIMKLIDRTRERNNGSNAKEVAALQATANLAHTPALSYHGPCNIQTRQYRGSSNSVTLEVNCVLMTYSGPSMDKLMHREFGLPYDHYVANPKSVLRLKIASTQK